MPSREIEVFADVRYELHRAQAKHKNPMRSSHEGYAILKEKVDEMWDAIKANDTRGARAEAVQVAAMAIRFLLDSRSRVPVQALYDELKGPAPEGAHVDPHPDNHQFPPEEVAQARD